MFQIDRPNTLKDLDRSSFLHELCTATDVNTLICVIKHKDCSELSTSRRNYQTITRSEMREVTPGFSRQNLGCPTTPQSLSSDGCPTTTQDGRHLACWSDTHITTIVGQKKRLLAIKKKENTFEPE